MPQRVQLHFTDDLVLEVHFPGYGTNAFHDRAYVTVPAMRSGPYGLEREWGIRLESSNNRLAVFVPMRPGYSEDPGIAVGMIFPDLTLPAELKAIDGYAIALIELREPIDLQDREGWITLYAERTERRPWLRELGLIELVMYPLVTIMTWREILRRCLSDFKLARNFVRAISDLANTLWPS